MKKKNIIFIALACILVVFAIAEICIVRRHSQNANVEGETDSSISASVSVEVPEIVPDDTPEDTSKEYVMGTEVPTKDYVFDWYYEKIYLLEDGKIIEKCDLSDIADFYEIYGFNGDDVIWSKFTRESNSDYYYTLMATNRVTGTANEIGIFKSIEGIDRYNGYIYVSEGSCKAVHALNQATYEETDDGFTAKVTEKCKDYQMLSYFSTYRYKSKACPKRILDEAGFILYSKDGKVYKFDGENLSETSLELNGSSSVVAYDSKYAFYEAYSDDYNDFSLYRYDYDSGESALVYVNARMLGNGANGNTYLSVNSEKDGDIVYSLVEVNVETLESKVIKEGSRAMGFGYCEPYYHSPAVVNGTLYFYDYDGDASIKWYAYDGKIKEINEMTEPVKVSNVLQMAHLEVAKEKYECEFCGKAIYKAYCEYPVLNSDIKYAGKISKYLKDMAQKTVKVTDPTILTMYMETDQYCEDHGYASSMETLDDLVVAIEYVGGHYLTVSYQGDWFGGGAHGYPSRSDYLFDLNTGNVVSFADLYTGTEEELKDLVATKAKEHIEYCMEAEDGGSPYFTDDPDTLYSEVYDLISLQNINIEYGKDHATVYFFPYELAGYAAGFVEYEIPYEEFKGE